MPRAKTVSQAKREAQVAKEVALTRALNAYTAGLETPKPPSLTHIALQFGVNRQTLHNRYKGMPSIAEFNAKKSHFSESESKVLIDLVLRQAQRGFPLTNRLIEEHANLILRA